MLTTERTYPSLSALKKAIKSKVPVFLDREIGDGWHTVYVRKSGGGVKFNAECRIEDGVIKEVDA